MKDSLYHSVLRVGILTLTLLLLFDSGLVHPLTRELSNGTQRYLANSVGVFAGVEETEVSRLTAELTERERALSEREAEFSERQIAVNVGEGVAASSPDYSTYVISVILFILLVLIVLNYALDYSRLKRLEHAREAA